MKTKILTAFATLVAVMFGGLATNAQVPDHMIQGGNPGIVMAGSQKYSQLPDKAKHFIDKHFKDVGVYKCEKYFAKGQYEVELRNGVDIEFNLKGEVTEIDAPDRTYLASSVVKDVLPKKSFTRLENQGLASKIESIEFKKGKAIEVEVDVPDPDTFIFDIDGNFIAIED